MVSGVDLARYMGVWYEIASYPNSFQKGCTATKAIYTMGEDGAANVLNECRKGSPQGELTVVRGAARVVDPATNAKRKVTFFWPFVGDYWIIDLGKEYEYAVVGHPTRKYLRILSRSPHMDETIYSRILEGLRTEKGYDTTRLVRTVQARQAEKTKNGTATRHVKAPLQQFSCRRQEKGCLPVSRPWTV